MLYFSNVFFSLRSQSKRDCILGCMSELVNVDVKCTTGVIKITSLSDTSSLDQSHEGEQCCESLSGTQPRFRVATLDTVIKPLHKKQCV